MIAGESSTGYCQRKFKMNRNQRTTFRDIMIASKKEQRRQQSIGRLPFINRETRTIEKRYRPDKDGTHRQAFERNKKKIYATQTVCGICGKPVDFSIKYPHPLSPCIDHIIPIAKGGHPSDMDNLQLAHFTCNRMKSDKLINRNEQKKNETTISNRVLPHSIDWTKYKGK